jgi:hypothetical protein
VVPHDEWSAQPAAARARELGADFINLYDDSGLAVKAWGISGEPTIILVDAEGRVVRGYDFVDMLIDWDAEKGAPIHLTAEDWKQRLYNRIGADLDALR